MFNSRPLVFSRNRLLWPSTSQKLPTFSLSLGKFSYNYGIQDHISLITKNDSILEPRAYEIPRHLHTANFDQPHYLKPPRSKSQFLPGKNPSWILSSIQSFITPSAQVSLAPRMARTPKGHWMSSADKKLLQLLGLLSGAEKSLKMATACPRATSPRKPRHRVPQSWLARRGFRLEIQATPQGRR